MTASESDRAFAGAVPRAYDAHLVPLLFEPYARDLAARVEARRPARILEVAAGTGVLTRAIASRLPGDVAIVATDLNAPMLDHAAALGTPRPVEWRQADAARLPFRDGDFDLVVCQFGVMFFPDRPAAYAEARRILRTGGAFLFSTWTALAENALAETVQEALAPLFPEDPPRFMERTPHGYFDVATIGRDLAAGGFAATPRVETLALRSRSRCARDVAVAFCHGTPLRGEIESRGASRLEQATAAVESALERRFGRGEIDAPMRAHVVEIAL